MTDGNYLPLLMAPIFMGAEMVCDSKLGQVFNISTDMYQRILIVLRKT
jgi:hypothetical protein